MPSAQHPIVIVGAGPAGMMLAYQLASNGMKVRVLERHKDFDREFRGEFIQPSIIPVLEQLGILEALRARGAVSEMSAVRMYRGKRIYASSFGVNGGPAGHAVHQPTFLELLHTQCERHADSYRLDRGAKVENLIEEDGRIRAVEAQINGKKERIDARLVVVCNGRSSSLRKAIHAEVEELEKPYSVLWLRFDLASQPDLVIPNTLDGYVTRRAFCVLYPTHGNRVQLMWRRSRDAPLDWKSNVDTLRAELLADTPTHWHPLFASMNEKTERQVLRVVCDRLRQWWAPGALFLGDAAHTMSPIGGQGVSVAVRDAIVAANHLLSTRARKEKEGGDADTTIDDALLAKIEAERRPEIETIQTFQTRAGRINDAPAAAQWLMATLIIPLLRKLQGASYLRQVQFGVTDVRMSHAVPFTSIM